MMEKKQKQAEAKRKKVGGHAKEKKKERKITLIGNFMSFSL